MSTPVRRALYGRLAGDTTLTGLLGVPAPSYAQAIYHEQAPPGAVHPFVIFNKQSGIPTDTFGLPTALQDDTWLVKVIDRSNSADNAEAASARITELLNDAPLSISATELLYLRRTSDLEYSETADGVLYRHAGALYRVVTTAVVEAPVTPLAPLAPEEPLVPEP